MMTQLTEDQIELLKKEFNSLKIEDGPKQDIMNETIIFSFDKSGDLKRALYKFVRHHVRYMYVPETRTIMACLQDIEDTISILKSGLPRWKALAYYKLVNTFGTKPFRKERATNVLEASPGTTSVLLSELSNDGLVNREIDPDAAKSFIYSMNHLP